MATPVASRIQVYFDKRVFFVFILGLAQGLPWVMIGSMLTLWLKEAGLSRSSIGFATLIFSVYAINFLWSPLVDMAKLPFSKRIGHRQSWIVLCQLVITSCCLLISTQDPAINAAQVVVFCLIIASFSATQDIAIDAYRVDSFAQTETKKISAAAGMITAGWWTGYAGMGAIPLILSDIGFSWQHLYILMGLFTFSLAVITLFLPNPAHANFSLKNEKFSRSLSMISRMKSQEKSKIITALGGLTGIVVVSIAYGLGGKIPGLPVSTFYFFAFISAAVSIIFLVKSLNAAAPTVDTALASKHNYLFTDKTIAWLLTALVEPLRDFFSRNGIKLAIMLLSFVLLFKLGEAFLGRMSIVFYKEVGFSNTQIATYSKLLTWWLTVFFALIAGVVNAKFGLVKGLFISGIAMSTTNLLFAFIAYVGPIEHYYAIAIVLDGFAQAWSTVAFVSLISLLCSHAFSATQYALLASLSNLGRTTIASSSGQVVDWLNGNWILFFCLTTVMVIPSLMILWSLKDYVNNLTRKDSN